MKEYNAGIVSHTLWNSEFKKYIQMYVDQGMTHEEILKLSDEENVFMFSSKARAKQISRILKRRVEHLPQAILDIYAMLDEGSKKVVNYISLMMDNRLVAEFTYEVYRDEIIIGDRILYPAEVMAFLMKKQGESEKIDSWSDKTIHRLRNVLTLMLREAGMVAEADKNGGFPVTPVYLDANLVQILLANNMDYYLQAVGG